MSNRCRDVDCRINVIQHTQKKVLSYWYCNAYLPPRIPEPEPEAEPEPENEPELALPDEYPPLTAKD